MTWPIRAAVVALFGVLRASRAYFSSTAFVLSAFPCPCRGNGFDRTQKCEKPQVKDLRLLSFQREGDETRTRNRRIDSCLPEHGPVAVSPSDKGICGNRRAAQRSLHFLHFTAFSHGLVAFPYRIPYQVRASDRASGTRILRADSASGSPAWPTFLSSVSRSTPAVTKLASTRYLYSVT
jgi:hypothetical protein